ncbi:MAG: aminomethyltransferase [Candidatus Atribacteria bacterium]|nr:aminomethyltransferase [Candidatus Atribacteria bacterium]
MPFLSRDGEEEWLLTTNSEARERVFNWLQTQVQAGGFSVTVRDLTPEFLLLSVQGPYTQEAISQFFNQSLSLLSRFEGTWVEYNSIKVRVSRMAFSRVDGLELLFLREEGEDFFLKLSSFLTGQGFSWCGFGVRDLLRFEAGFPLYGREMDETVTPLELGKEKLIDWKKENFIGKPPLVLEKKLGSKKKLIGMEVEGKGIPRWGYPIYNVAGLPCGYVTSGNYSFTLKKNLAMGFISSAQDKLVEELYILASKKKLKARMVPLPFLS